MPSSTKAEERENEHDDDDRAGVERCERFERHLVDRRHRGQGIARAALKGALDQIAAREFDGYIVRKDLARRTWPKA